MKSRARIPKRDDCSGAPGLRSILRPEKQKKNSPGQKQQQRHKRFCTVSYFHTFISSSRRSNPPFLSRLPSLEVTAGCVRSESAGRHTNAHAGLARLVTCCAVGEQGEPESKTSRQRQNFIVWFQRVCLFFFLQRQPRSISDIVPVQERGREERQEGGGLHLFFFLHSATCECHNCILMRNNEDRMRRGGPGLDPDILCLCHLHTQTGTPSQAVWVCVCVSPAWRQASNIGWSSALPCHQEAVCKVAGAPALKRQSL